MPFYKKIQARKVEETVVCPGGGAECPQGTTCCQLDSGEYEFWTNNLKNFKIFWYNGL